MNIWVWENEKVVAKRIEVRKNDQNGMTIFRDRLSCWLLVRCSKPILTEDHDTKDPCMTSQRVPENRFLGSKLSKRTIPPIKIWLDSQILIRCFRLRSFASWVFINYYKKPRKEKNWELRWNKTTYRLKWMNESCLKVYFQTTSDRFSFAKLFSYMISFCCYLLWISFRGYQN